MTSGLLPTRLSWTWAAMIVLPAFVACSSGDVRPIGMTSARICGDGICEPGETTSCPQDCLLLTICGDGVCAPSESLASCPRDCGGAWFPIGPAPVQDTVSNQPGSHIVPNLNASGRATVLAVNPQNASDVWLGTAGGGVWHTTQLGKFQTDTHGVKGGIDPEWLPFTDDQPSLAVGAIALEDCNATRCNSIWVGTGENNIRRTTYYGAGLIHIVWVPQGGGENPTPEHYQVSPVATDMFRFGSINDIRIAADKSLYVAVASGVTITAATASRLAPAPSAGYGLHKFNQTTNTWSVVLPMSTADGETGLPDDLEFLNNRFFLGVYNTGILRSEPGTDAQWCYLNPGVTQPASCPNPSVSASSGLPDPTKQPFDHVEIAARPGSQTVYALFGQCGQDRTLQNCLSNLFKSIDGGSTWSSVGTSGREYSRYMHMLVVHPEDDNDIFHGGLDLLESTTSSGTNFLDKASGTLHGDIHDLAIIPADVRKTQCQADPTCSPCVANPAGPNCPDLTKDLLYCATDGGTYFGEFAKGVTGSSGAGFAWESANHNLLTTQFYGIGANIIKPSGFAGAKQGTVVFGGIQDTGVLFFNGSRVWALQDQGDGGSGFVGTNGELLASREEGLVVGLNGILPPVNTELAPGLAGGGVAGNHLRNSFFTQFARVTPGAGSSGFYYATDAVFTESTLSTSILGATQVSPAFVDTQSSNPTCVASGNCPPEIAMPDGVITTIAVGGGNNPRIWVGLWNGQVWVSKATSGTLPCANLSCWSRVDASGMPKTTVSSIELDPNNPARAFVSFSGFGNTPMVWTTSNVDGGGFTAVAGLPANNPVKVIRLDPRDGQTLFAGTDQGLWSQIPGHAGWFQYNLSNSFLPTNVPVLDVRVDQGGNRVFVATHGRGVWMQTAKPQLNTFEGWTADGIWDIPIYGSGFNCASSTSNTCNCMVSILLRDGTVCAGPSALDADLTPGTIVAKPGSTGNFLTTQNGSSWNDKPVVWACREGGCLPDSGGHRTPIANCKQNPNNPISAVQVKCDGNDAVLAPVAGQCPQLAQPPSSLLSVTSSGSPGGMSPIGPGGGKPAALASLTSASSFSVVPTVVASAANGGDRALCSAHVSFTGGETDAQRQQTVAGAINSSIECVSAGLSASVLGPRDEEDTFNRTSHVVLNAPKSLIGTQVILGVRADPGEAASLCFDLDQLGVYSLSQVAVMQLGLTTAPGGALGGSIALSEQSPIGLCQRSVPTAPGQSETTTAASLIAAFHESGNPGPMDCPANANPRDVEQFMGDPTSVVTILPNHVSLCVADRGVGFHYGPAGVDLNLFDAAFSQIALFGSHSLEIGDRAVAKEPNGTFAIVAGAGKATTTVGTDVNLGNVLSVGNVQLGDRTHVHGLVKSDGSVIKGNAVVVDGSIMQGGDVRLPNILLFLAPFPTADNGDLFLGPGSQGTASPGSFGKVTVQSRATLSLSSGTYFFKSFDLEPQATLSIQQTGPVRIYVRDSFIDNQAAVSTTSGAQPNLLLVYQGASDATLNGPFLGTLVAPNARLTLASQNAQPLQGAFFAWDLNVQPSIVMTHVPFSPN